ncbi:hypothetical protein HOO65_020849 [Ceratocystis lukuohia]|uniref:Uncharacterized protein n=2 Tax=Ceratocystis TaxID=5157 RepID=A0A0F8B120_CERFI|nr:hypothetical protein CFO_g4430 [Ceratocystis platani]
MTYEGTVTIINNSGKIISTGRQLLNIWKEAKASYDERKAHIRQARNGTNSAPVPEPSYEEEEDDEVPPLQQAIDYSIDEFDPTPRPQARLYLEDDNRSYVSLRSHRSHRSSRSHRTSHTTRTSKTRTSRREAPSEVGNGSTVSGATQLTRSNLRALTEVSSVAPSQAPDGYRSPYAETAPRDMQVSRPAFARAQSEAPRPEHQSHMEVMQRPPMPVATRRSKAKDDSDLAYGNLPPDLATRYDLEAWEESSDDEDPSKLKNILEDEKQVKSLIRSVEQILDEAHCVQHTASSIIEHLQGNPEAAAAVALTLAELSSILGKLSPSIIGLVRGGSPAVFALLASPQFLIGATAAVGVTVVMFGGWKIIKQLQGEAVTTQKVPMAMAAQPLDGAGPRPGSLKRSATMPAGSTMDGANSLVGSQPQQALVLDNASEVSSIESWRRGIPVFSDDEAELELISPHAHRHHSRGHSGSGFGGGKDLAELDPWDSVSQAGRPDRPPRSSHRSSAASSVSKSSRRSNSTSRNPRDRDGASSSVSRSKSVASRSSTRAPSEAGTKLSSSSSKSKALSVASSKPPSKAPSRAGSVVSTSSSSSKKNRKEDKDSDVQSRAGSERSHRSSSSKSVVSTSSSSSSSSKKDQKKKDDKDEKKDEKKPNLLKAMFHKKKTQYTHSAVVV